MICLKDFEDYAAKHLEFKTWIFYSQGAEREHLVKENAIAFTNYTIIPRMRLNSCQRNLSTTVLGHKVSLPIGFSPTAYQKLAHPEGEIAACKASEKMGSIYTLSIVSNTSLEDVANCIVGRTSPLWMQVSLVTNRATSEKLIRKAENNGYNAIVLTVDNPISGLRYRMWKTGGVILPPHLSMPNVKSTLNELNKSGKMPSHIELTSNLFDRCITWDDVRWIRSITKLPIVLKGIVTAEDAIKAVDHGVAGIWVSNHGGRQLDCVDTTIEALPKIVSATTGSGCEIYIDGGIRYGTDVFKALALGARAVFIGRPLLWGLAHSGQHGVQSVLNILKAELDRAMHLSGCQNIEDISTRLVKKKHFAKI